MTTVIDPNGTAIPVFNRSGTSIISLVGNQASTPTPINTVSEATIVLLSRGQNVGDENFILTGSVDVGDVIEAYGADGHIFQIYLPSGETLVNTFVGPIPTGSGSNYQSVRLRRVDSTHWAAIQSS